MRVAGLLIAGVLCLLTVVLPDAVEAATQGCTYSITPRSTHTNTFNPGLPAGGIQGFTVTVTAPDGCAWSAATHDAFVTVVSANSGVGRGTVSLDVAPNPGGLRFGTVIIAGQTFVLHQSGCLTVRTNPSLDLGLPGYWRTLTADASGGPRTVRIEIGSRVCDVRTAVHAPWISLAPGQSLSPETTSGGVLRYDLLPNASGGSRTGSFSVGHLTFSVTQTAGVRGDLNGDLWPDLLWHHRQTGEVATWLMRGVTRTSGQLLDPPAVPDTGWKPVSVADVADRAIFDGQSDLFWQHDDGRLAFWHMRGLTQSAGFLAPAQMPSADWRVAAVADLNSDGHPDIVWHHRTTGEVTFWLMFGGWRLFESASVSPGGVSDTDWKVLGAADFNRDGQVDLLWRHSSGMVAVWLLEWTSAAGWTVRDGRLLEPGQVADTDWQIRGVIDLDRDGHADILWQHETTGGVAIWLMTETTLRDGRFLTPGHVNDLNWIIVGPR